jgi:hypothetical protein
VNEQYLETLRKWDEDIEAFDISGLLNNFLERIRPEPVTDSKISNFTGPDANRSNKITLEKEK